MSIWSQMFLNPQCYNYKMISSLVGDCVDSIFSIQYRFIITYSWKFSRYVYFAAESLIRIFADKILQMAYDGASFQLKMMLNSEFPHIKFSLLIDHL